jgi:peptidoglycan/LPS O-acetylase OafA/YrhL
LRFFAALYVVFYHSIGLLIDPKEPHPAIDRILSLAYVNISFFFLLSGYILSIAYLRTGKIARGRNAFFLSRFARVYPLFLVTLILDTPDWFVAHARDFGGKVSAILPTVAVFLEHLLMLQAWLPWQRGIDRPNWTLSVDTFLYLLFPFIGMRVWNLCERNTLGFASIVWPTGQLLLFLASRYLSLDAAMFVPVFHLSSFLLGIALARAQDLNQNRIQSWSNATVACLLLLAALLTVPFFLFPDMVGKQYLNNGLLIPVCAVIILAVSLNEHAPARLLGQPFFIELGYASYAFYLLHVPILHLLQRFHLHRSAGLYAGYLATCLVLSLLAHRYFETPMRLMILRRWPVGGRV